MNTLQKRKTSVHFAGTRDPTEDQSPSGTAEAVSVEGEGFLHSPIFVVDGAKQQQGNGVGGGSSVWQLFSNLHHKFSVDMVVRETMGTFFSMGWESSPPLEEGQEGAKGHRTIQSCPPQLDHSRRVMSRLNPATFRRKIRSPITVKF